MTPDISAYLSFVLGIFLAETSGPSDEVVVFNTGSGASYRREGEELPAETRDGHLVTPGEVGQGAPDDLLAAARGVDVRRVEEVDPGLDRRPDQGSALLLGQRPRVRPAVGFAERHAPNAQG